MHKVLSYRTFLLLGSLLLSAASPALLADSEGMCANDQQAAEITAFFAENNPIPAMGAQRLKMPEALVVSAFPAERAMGTTGEAFHEVWTRLNTLDDAMLLLLKGGHVFEIRGSVPPGTPSTRSKYFNIGYAEENSGLSGHLRPDLVSAIYAFVLPGERGGTVRSVFFYGGSGNSDFGIIVAAGEDESTAAKRAVFDDIWAVIEASPRVCS